MNRKVIALAAAGLTTAALSAGTFATATASTGATATASTTAVKSAASVKRLNYGVGNSKGSSTGTISFASRTVSVTGKVTDKSNGLTTVSFTAYSGKNATGKKLGTQTRGTNTSRGFNFALASVRGGAGSVKVMVTTVDSQGGWMPAQTIINK